MTFNSLSRYAVVLSLLSIFAAPGMLMAQEATVTTAAPRDPNRYTVSGAGSGSADSDEEEDDGKVTGATVRGRVLYEDTGRPVRYALVMLSKSVSDSYGRKYVRTDENGEFVFKNVKEGKYFPVVKGAGILEERPGEDRAATTDKKPKEEGPTAEIAVSGLGEFQTFVRVRRGAAVGGRITYADGEAAVGVKVQVLDKAGDRFSAPFGQTGSATTDDRGVYRIAGLRGGTYVVRVIEPGGHGPGRADYEYNLREKQDSISRTYYPEGDMSKGAKELELVLGEEQNGIDITIPDRRRFTMSGTIKRKRDGEPLEKFNVTFVNLSQSDPAVRDFGGGGFSINSNKAGEWTLRNLPKGKYRVMVSQGYNYRPDTEKTKPETYPSMEKEVEITDKDVSGVAFEIPTGASISGSITVEGGKDVPNDLRIFALNAETGEAKVEDYNYGREEGNKTPKQQIFKIADLKEGKYNIIVANDNYFIKSISGTAGVQDSAVDIKEGNSINGIKIVLSGEVGIVKGKVSGGNPGDTIVVALIKAGSSFEQLRTNARAAAAKPNGEFELKWSPGEYTLIAFEVKKQPRTEAGGKEWLEKLIRDGTRITLKTGEVTNAVISLPK